MGWIGSCVGVEAVIDVGAGVVSHGRYVVLQLAEVAVPQELFRQGLQGIRARARKRPRARSGGVRYVPTSLKTGPALLSFRASSQSAGRPGSFRSCSREHKARVKNPTTRA